MAKGRMVTVENPLLSYLWLLDEWLEVLGVPGMRLVRIDHCMFGAPYQKPQLWATNCPGAERLGR
eukprot:10781993-Alexandrium_andersonii.AAC.1